MADHIYLEDLHDFVNSRNKPGIAFTVAYVQSPRQNLKRKSEMLTWENILNYTKHK